MVASGAASVLSFAAAGVVVEFALTDCPIFVRSGGVEVAGELTDSGGSGSRILDAGELTDPGVLAPLDWLRRAESWSPVYAEARAVGALGAELLRRERAEGGVGCHEFLRREAFGEGGDLFCEVGDAIQARLDGTSNLVKALWPRINPEQRPLA